MGYIEAFPPIQALGRRRLQQLCSEWIQSPVARECGVGFVVINADASDIFDVGLRAPKGQKKGEVMHFPADHLMRFIIDREFSGETQVRLHQHLVDLRSKVGVELFQRFVPTVDVH